MKAKKIGFLPEIILKPCCDALLKFSKALSYRRAPSFAKQTSSFYKDRSFQSVFIINSFPQVLDKDKDKAAFITKTIPSLVRISGVDISDFLEREIGAKVFSELVKTFDNQTLAELYFCFALHEANQEKPSRAQNYIALLREEICSREASFKHTSNDTLQEGSQKFIQQTKIFRAEVFFQGGEKLSLQDPIGRILEHQVIKQETPTPSRSQHEIFQVLQKIYPGENILQEEWIEEAAAIVDFKIGDLILEFNGPHHYIFDDVGNLYPTPKEKLRLACLKNYCLTHECRLVIIDFDTWNA